MAGVRDKGTRVTGHGHGHGPAVSIVEDPGQVRQARIGLAVVVVPLLISMGVAMVVLWPRGPLPVPAAARNAYAGVVFVKAEIRAVHNKACPGDVGDRLPDGSIPTTTTCHTADAVVESGPEPGTQVTVGIGPDVARAGLAVGDQLQLARYPAVDGDPVRYAFVDFARDLPLGVLALAFALLVVLVARLRGLLSLVGLVLAFATIGWFVLPALRHQENPMLVTAVASTVIMMVILYLAHGITRKTTTALLGTVAGIWVSAGLAQLVTTTAHLNGLISEENIQLNRMTPFGDLSGLVTSGIILAGLGVLNDVTITQASSVWEFHQLAPHQPLRRLFASGMQVGRDHLASIVYTLAFAYAGAALPSILLGTLYARPLGQWLVTGTSRPGTSRPWTSRRPQPTAPTPSGQEPRFPTFPGAGDDARPECRSGAFATLDGSACGRAPAWTGRVGRGRCRAVMAGVVDQRCRMPTTPSPTPGSSAGLTRLQAARVRPT